MKYCGWVWCFCFWIQKNCKVQTKRQQVDSCQTKVEAEFDFECIPNSIITAATDSLQGLSSSYRWKMWRFLSLICPHRRPLGAAASPSTTRHHPIHPALRPQYHSLTAAGAIHSTVGSRRSLGGFVESSLIRAQCLRDGDGGW